LMKAYANLADHSKKIDERVGLLRPRILSAIRHRL
jgi:hypothetical protein